MKDVIFLIGYRAVGKTTLGQSLADSLGYSFLDTDHLICDKEKKPIQKIVEEGGWTAFRSCEKKVLADLFKRKKCVIATGGGAILHLDIWRTLRDKATVIWLTAERDVLINRLTGDATTDSMRPTLTGKGVVEELEEVLASREPLYEEISHISIDTGKMSVKEAVKSILVKTSSISLTKE